MHSTISRWLTSAHSRKTPPGKAFAGWKLCLSLVLPLMLTSLGGCASFSNREHTSTEDSGRLRLRSIDQRMQAEACRRTALELAKHESDEHAIAQFERARELYPGIRGVAYPLAVLYDRQGSMDAADREYQRALRETPRQADLLNDYGYFLYFRGDFAGAERNLNAALKEQPNHSKALVNLGLVLTAQQRFEEAYASFERAVGPAAAHHNMGVLLAAAGHDEEARRHLELAVRRDPSLRRSQSILAHLDRAEATSDVRYVSASESDAGRVELAR